MRTKICLLALSASLLLNYGWLTAQEIWISEASAPLTSVSIYEAPLQDNVKLLASSRSHNPKDGPLTFAKTISTRIKSAEAGTWETLENGN